MNNWFIVIFSAFLQGLTEFLPVSSSGHLALFSNLTNLPTDAGIGFGIVLHAGSLLAIAAFYFKTLLGFFKKDQLHLLWMMIIGSIPAGIIGITLKKTGLIELFFDDMLSVAMGFLITASLLRLTGKAKLRANTETELKDITVKQALMVGFFQAGAIIPGISRSGATISAGILSGIKFEAAATFSFLLALPAIAGATLLEIIDLSRQGFQLGELTKVQLASGFIISAAVSFAALKLLVYLVKKGRLAWFSWYLFLLGTVIMIWQILSINKG